MGKEKIIGKITFRLPDELEKECKRKANTFNVSISEYIRECIKAGPSIRYHFKNDPEWERPFNINK